MTGDLIRLLDEKGIKLIVSDGMIGYIAEKSYSVKYGARNMRRFIQTELEDRIAELIISSRGNLSAVSADVVNGECVIKSV
jgi:ATP-dependent Clp protease ATP-binding subunit ClpA